MRWRAQSGPAKPTATPARHTGASTSRRPPGHPEDDLQQAIIQFHARWVDQTQAVVFACPNGEKRDAKTASRLSGMSAAAREELPEDRCLTPAGLGVLPGVSDLLLLLAEARLVLIEIKIPKVLWPPVGEGLPLFSNVKRVVQHQAGRQSKTQKRFQAGAEALGHLYRVIRSVDDYKALLLELGVRLRDRPLLGI